MIIPSIDLQGGKIVQLKQGLQKILEETDIDKIIEKYKYFSEVNLIDIDRAKGQGNNFELVKYICSKLDCNVGGGIRDEKIAKDILKLNPKAIIIGTSASYEFLSKLPKEKIIVALDTKDKKLAKNGWQNFEEFSLEKRVRELETVSSGFLITNIDVEGLNNGVDMEYIKFLQKLILRDNEFSQNRIMIARRNNNFR